MPRMVTRNLTVTRVSYKTVVVENSAPRFEDHPDAIFPGVLEREKVEKLLRSRLGKDTTVVITNIDAGQHRYEMELEKFVLNAKVADCDGDDPESENKEENEETEGEVTGVGDDPVGAEGVVGEMPNQADLDDDAPF